MPSNLLEADFWSGGASALPVIRESRDRDSKSDDPRSEADDAKIKDASELWELERYLTRRRKEIDAKYEYKYSVLLLVLADLVRRRACRSG